MNKKRKGFYYSQNTIGRGTQGEPSLCVPPPSPNQRAERKRTGREKEIKKYAVRLIRLTLIMLFVSMPILLSLVPVGSCQPETDAVGVKAGDWVRYGVARSGGNMAWIYNQADWFMVEVLNVSGTVVTYRETIHEDDGDKFDNNSSVNVQIETDRLGYFIPADLHLGDKVGEFTMPDMENPNPNSFVTVNLTITSDEFRTYGGVTREVNVMKFAWDTPFFEYIAHFTWEKCWDKQTGFLLEMRATGYLLGFEELGFNETNPESIYVRKIVDTNMWEMETEQPFPWQVLIVAIPICAVVLAVMAIKMRNNRKQKGLTKNEGPFCDEALGNP